MILYNTMQLSTVICDNPTLIPIVSRLGIRLGFAEKTIDEVAAQYGIDPDFLLTILNTYLNDSFFPHKKMQDFDIKVIVHFLTSTYEYYEKYQIANIEKHLFAFFSSSRIEPNSVEAIKRLWDGFTVSLRAQMDYDRDTVFPAIEHGGAGRTGEGACCAEPHAATDESAQLILEEMLNVLVKYISGDYNENLCYAVIFGISRMAKDIKQHNRIRDRILLPMIVDLNL